MHKCTAHAEVPHRWISTVKKPLCRRQKQSLLTWTTWWCDWVLYSDIFACLELRKVSGPKTAEMQPRKPSGLRAGSWFIQPDEGWDTCGALCAISTEEIGRFHSHSHGSSLTNWTGLTPSWFILFGRENNDIQILSSKNSISSTNFFVYKFTFYIKNNFICSGIDQEKIVIFCGFSSKHFTGSGRWDNE